MDRLIDALPAEEREQTKSFMSQSLIGVVTQTLVRTPDLRGRRAVCEVMVTNRAIGKLLMTDQTHMIPSQLQTGRDAGMQLMDQALLAAVQAGEVDPEDAFQYALDKRPFTRYVNDGTAILKADVTQGMT
jgi:twitching motility protein PilT